MKRPNHNLTQRGASLIELILYIGITAILSVSLTYSIIFLINNYKKIKIRGEVFNEADAALSAIGEEIRSARTIYSPVSVFGENQGQLSLKTLRGLPEKENWTYIDFYLDNQRIYLKREETDGFPITSERVLISQLKFSQIGTGTTTPSIKIDLTLSPNLPANNPYYFSQSFSSLAGLRN